MLAPESSRRSGLVKDVRCSCGEQIAPASASQCARNVAPQSLDDVRCDVFVNVFKPLSSDKSAPDEHSAAAIFHHNRVRDPREKTRSQLRPAEVIDPARQISPRATWLC